MASGSIYQVLSSHEWSFWQAGTQSDPQHRAQDGAPIYNARGLSDTLDRVKQEFEVLASELTISRDQRERYEATSTFLRLI